MRSRRSDGTVPRWVQRRLAHRDPPAEQADADGTSSTHRTWTALPEESRVPDYYAFLGVERNATGEQLERAYRKHVAMIHPDRFFDHPLRRDLAQEKLKELNAVMQVLRDPDRRAQYDATLLGSPLPAMPLTSRLRKRQGRT